MSQAEGEVADTTLAVIWNGDSIDARIGARPGGGQRRARRRSCASPSPHSGATGPTSTHPLVAHAVFGRLAELLWQHRHADSRRGRSPRRVHPRRGQSLTRSRSTVSVSRPAARMSRPPAPRPATLLEEPFAALGSTRPELDAALVAHAVFGRLAELLWQGAHADRAEVDHLVDFCLGAVSSARVDLLQHRASVSRPAARMCAAGARRHAVPLRVVAHHLDLAQVVVVDGEPHARRRRAPRSCTPRHVRAPRSQARRGAARGDDRVDTELGERATVGAADRVPCGAVLVGRGRDREPPVGRFHEAVVGLVADVVDVPGTGAGRSGALVNSPPWNATDVRLSATSTSWPSPRCVRAYSAAMVPNAASVPVPMSCSDIGWITGWSAPPCATMIPLRACRSGSKPAVPASGPSPQPSMWQCTRPGLPARRPSRSRSQVLGHLAGHVLDQRVGVVHERGERLAPGRVLEVEAHLVLVAVQRRERRRRDGAEVLAAGRIDLHHPRAEVLQHEAPERPREELGGVDDEHAVERERPPCLPSLASARSVPTSDGRAGASEPGVRDSTAGRPGPTVPSSPGTGSSRSLAATVSLAAHSARVCTGA